MSRYSTSQQRMEERRWKIHPVWRGIGCVMILLVFILSYAAADVFVTANNTKHWFPVTAEMMQPVAIPRLQVPTTIIDINIGVIHPSFTYADLMFTFVFLFVGFGFLTVLYSVFYKFMGPPRYNRFDSPQVKKLRKEW